jgi:WD40 repeat protein
MPTTRAARRAAAGRKFLELPTDALGLVLYQLPLAHDIAAVAPTCHTLCDAAKLAQKARPFSAEVATLDGNMTIHRNAVWDVAAAPDGRVITGSEDGTAKVWRDGAWECTIFVNTEDVTSLAVLPGARCVSVGEEAVKLWTLDGALERTFEVGSWACDGHSVAVLPDGVHFVVGLANSEVRLYHVDGTLVHTFKGHTDSLMSVAVTPDGQHIISGSHDKLVKVWSVASKSLVSTCEGHTDWLEAVAAMPDGQRILSGSMDNTVRVWLLDGTHLNTFSELHDAWVRALVALPDNQHALSASNDCTVKLFNVNDGTLLRTFRHHVQPDQSHAVVCLALLPDGLRFVSGSCDGTACIAYHGLAPQ